jgi:hypothetical protein
MLAQIGVFGIDRHYIQRDKRTLSHTLRQTKRQKD